VRPESDDLGEVQDGELSSCNIPDMCSIGRETCLDRFH
jgi:hypothetical protein